MKNKLDILNRVTKAEAPTFLYTRITQRIQALQETPASVKFKFAFAAAATVVLILNAWVFTKKLPTHHRLQQWKHLPIHPP